MAHRRDYCKHANRSIPETCTGPWKLRKVCGLFVIEMKHVNSEPPSYVGGRCAAELENQQDGGGKAAASHFFKVPLFCVAEAIDHRTVLKHRLHPVLVKC